MEIDEDETDTYQSPASDDKVDNDSASLPLLVNFKGLTVNDSVVAILLFAAKCRLAGVDFCDLMDLLHLLLPKPNNLPSSKHSMFNIFKTDREALNVTYYCNICWKVRISLQDKSDLCKGGAIKYFITASLASQLNKFYSRPGFTENIEDLYDSQIYKEAEKSINLNEFNISLTWYTDGVSLYNCSSYSLWPFMFVINELPPNERFKQENLIIGGLWGDSEKPHPNVFLRPIYSEVVKLRTGFSVKLYGEDVEKKGHSCCVVWYC